jgi:hypothetical protein
LNNFTDYKKLKRGIVNLQKVYVNVMEEEDNAEVLAK